MSIPEMLNRKKSTRRTINPSTRTSRGLDDKGWEDVARRTPVTQRDEAHRSRCTRLRSCPGRPRRLVLRLVLPAAHRCTATPEYRPHQCVEGQVSAARGTARMRGRHLQSGARQRITLGITCACKLLCGNARVLAVNHRVGG